MVFEAYLGISGRTATIYLVGRPSNHDLPAVRSLLREVTDKAVHRLVVRAEGLERVSAAMVRYLAATAQESTVPMDILLVGANDQVRMVFRQAGLDVDVAVAPRSD